MSLQGDSPYEPNLIPLSNFKNQLKNITQIQAKIQETKKELQHLTKIENSQSKNLISIYKASMMTTRNKINVFQNHQYIRKKHENDIIQIQQKHMRVKEMREKEQKQIRQIKQNMKKNKEQQRLLIKNNSIQYAEAIKKNKIDDHNKKIQFVKEIKKEKENHRKILEESKIQQVKKKEKQNFNMTLAKINSHSLLEKQLSSLIRRKEQTQNRLQEKKNLNEKIKQQVQKIKKLKQDQVLNILKEAENEIKRDPSKQRRLAPLSPLSIEKGQLKSIEALEPKSIFKSHFLNDPSVYPLII